ncbi:MAG: hypothetical protein B7X04_04180 [Parcubacteria group bacterium 21-54-25]|nr:MAG: hypothetical protein B7X04_04180 [Parcubacteria group bacterium 21-54-25]HQU08233.1 sigma-70 family RNA polymerase sigma factor [Candidatus Paceibacterota bacterium]
MKNGEGRVDAGEYLPLVRSIAKALVRKRSVPTWVEMNDLVQDGCVGLLCALKDIKSDSKGLDVTYLVIRIRGEMIDGIRKRGWKTRASVRAAKEVQDARYAVEQRYLRPATAREIANEMKIPIDQYLKLLVVIETRHISLSEVNTESEAFEDTAETPMQSAEAQGEREWLHRMQEKLPAEQRYFFLQLRRAHIQKELMLIFGVSEARISQMAKSLCQCLSELYAAEKEMAGTC